MIQRMNLATYEQLTAQAKVLEKQSFGVKVWLLPDQRIIKLFRRKRKLSSSRLYPYNVRFARNALRLQARGIAAPNIEEIFFCDAIDRHGVIYDLLEGESFHDLFPHSDVDALIHIFAEFLVELHEKGVYFRSVHPGNVLLRHNSRMGLIDIQDMRFWPFALPQHLRARNFRHLFNSDEHSQVMREFGFERFTDIYLQALPRSDSYRKRLKPKIMAYDRAWERKRQ